MKRLRKYKNVPGRIVRDMAGPNVLISIKEEPEQMIHFARPVFADGWPICGKNAGEGVVGRLALDDIQYTVCAKCALNVQRERTNVRQTA